VSPAPTTIEEAARAEGEYRAGGTDLQQRLRTGVSSGPPVDLGGLPGLDGIDWDDDGAARIGALVPVAALATDSPLSGSYSGLAQAARALATPQIRSAGTLGGNLLQRNRCWYYRHPDIGCLKKGGAGCPARTGNHLLHVCFDLGPCVAPHPSTLGMALLAYDAQLDVAGGPTRSVADLYGDGSDGRHDHQLAEQELLTAVRMPRPLDGERAAYFRATSRTQAEWPLVEALVRLTVADGRITFVRVAVGGVAPVPLRLERVEEVLADERATSEVFERAASLAAEGANPLPMSRYKVALLQGTVRETLDRVLA
jgi:xanthine dehydrogenase YagS FAD-binding subunit